MLRCMVCHSETHQRKQRELIVATTEYLEYPKPYKFHQTQYLVVLNINAPESPPVGQTNWAEYLPSFGGLKTPDMDKKLEEEASKQAMNGHCKILDGRNQHQTRDCTIILRMDWRWSGVFWRAAGAVLKVSHPVETSCIGHGSWYGKMCSFKISSIEDLGKNLTKTLITSEENSKSRYRVMVLVMK